MWPRCATRKSRLSKGSALVEKMPEPEVGKCYRWASNKYVLGSFIKKEDVSYVDSGQHGENLGMVHTTYYRFSNQSIHKATLGNIEECPCVGGGSKSRRGRRKRALTRRRR